MVLYKVTPPKKESIVSSNKFVTDKILPIGIKESGVKNTYFILFIAYQDYDESYIYLQLLVAAESPFEKIFIDENDFNIANINPNTEKGKAYTDLISKMNSDNLYGTDFCMEQNEQFISLYKSLATRGIDKTHCATMEVNYTRDNYIRLRLYLDKLSNLPMDKKFQHIEMIFANRRYDNIEFVNIEKIKYDATATTSNTNNGRVVVSHYTMWCGPSKYTMNYMSACNDDTKILTNPLDLNMYMAIYSKDFYILDTLLNDDGSMYIIYEEYNKVDGSWKSTKALILSKELVKQTNFGDPLNKIFK